MIRIILGEEIDRAKLPGEEKPPGRHGKFRYDCEQYPEVCGYSRIPLIDAAHQLKELGVDTNQPIGLFRPWNGRPNPDLFCPTIEGAARLKSKGEKNDTVSEE
jgi:hypothetical protein